MAVIFVVRLIFVIFDADEVAVDRLRVQGKSYECVDSCSLGDDLEGPGLEKFSSCSEDGQKANFSYLFVLELDDFVVTADYLVTFILRSLEQLWQSKPLARHLVPFRS